MRFLATLALAALLASCSKSPCQELGEKLCSCTGLSSASCTTQVQDQLKQHGMSESTCDAYLATCKADLGVDFCEWLLTESGKEACGIAPAPAP